MGQNETDFLSNCKKIGASNGTDDDKALVVPYT
ncbi:uncharacterized protein G2W53_006016 [Senna tora]|uniref:Uncharacterized protein n=1 Tax=Senna tora TaxID=362788 RepID=A0A834X3Y6_9FABA|nr:uncharacterized protein G2W53_006016 [Senna tora]